MEEKAGFSQTNLESPHGIRLAFGSPELEEKFQRQYFDRHWNQNRVAICFGLVLFALFGFVDWVVGGDHWQTILLIRLGIVLPLLMILLAAFFVRNISERYMPQMTFLALLISGSAIVVMNTLLPDEFQNLHFTGLLVTMIVGLAFFRTDFRWPAAAAAITFILYLLVTWKIHPLPFPLVLASFHLFVTAFLGMLYICWSLELKERQAFLMAQRLRELAHTDELTALANRRAFINHFHAEWRRALRYHNILALLLIDLDHLKWINDTYGHHAGDKALQQLAKILAGYACRPGDIAARLGGDEFVLLQYGAELARVKKMAANLAKKTAVLLVPDSNREICLTTSIGLVTAIPTQSMTPELLLKMADEALYEAKQSGRARAVHKHLQEPVRHQATLV